MDIVIRDQIGDVTVCISHCPYTIGKDMNPIILPPTLNKKYNRLGSSTLVWQLVIEKEKSIFKPVKLRLKNGLLPHLAREEYIYIYIYIYINYHIYSLESTLNFIFTSDVTIYLYIGCLNIHGTYVTANNSTNNDVFFSDSDLKIVYYI